MEPVYHILITYASVNRRLSQKMFMKILFLSSAVEALGVHEYRFLRSLLQAGYDVTLVSYHPDEVAANVKELAGLKIIHHKPRLLMHLQRVFYGNRVAHFGKVLRMIKPDIVHAGNVWNYGFLGALSGFHPLLVMPFGSDILLDPIRYPYVKYINRFTINRADMITCDAITVKKRITTDYGYPEEKIVVFPWGVEFELFHRSDSFSTLRKKLKWDHRIIFITNRHFLPVYGITTFIKAFAEARKHCPAMAAFVIGDGPLREEVHRLVDELALNDDLHLAGRIKREEMSKYLNASDVYVSTSLSDGTSVSLLEAMACGLPVVVTNVPTNFEWVGDGINGFIVPINDISTLASKLISIAKDVRMRKQMGNSSLKIAEEYADWNKNVKKLEAIYDQLLSVS